MSIPTEDWFAPLTGSQCNFNVQEPGRKRARKAAYSARHVSYGNLNVIQLGGRLEAERDFVVYCPSDAELQNIDKALSQQGTLHYAEGDVIAALVAYDATAYWLSTEQLVTLSFICDAD